jgi:hypothetical protein
MPPPEPPLARLPDTELLTSVSAPLTRMPPPSPELDPPTPPPPVTVTPVIVDVPFVLITRFVPSPWILVSRAPAPVTTSSTTSSSPRVSW